MEHWFDGLTKRLARGAPPRSKFLTGLLSVGATALAAKVYEEISTPSMALALPAHSSDRLAQGIGTPCTVTVSNSGNQVTVNRSAQSTLNGTTLILSSSSTLTIGENWTETSNINITSGTDTVFSQSIRREIAASTSVNEVDNLDNLPSLRYAVSETFGKAIGGISRDEFTLAGEMLSGSVNGRAIVPKNVLPYLGPQPTTSPIPTSLKPPPQLPRSLIRITFKDGHPPPKISVDPALAAALQSLIDAAFQGTCTSASAASIETPLQALRPRSGAVQREQMRPHFVDDLHLNTDTDARSVAQITPSCFDTHCFTAAYYPLLQCLIPGVAAGIGGLGVAALAASVVSTGGGAAAGFILAFVGCGVWRLTDIAKCYNHTPKQCPTLPGCANCSDSCVNTQTDSNNCGNCGSACSSGQTCSNGSCVCPAGLTSCQNQCVNTQTDNNNCGACGTVCNSPFVCVIGANGGNYCACPGSGGKNGNGSYSCQIAEGPVYECCMHSQCCGPYGIGCCDCNNCQPSPPSPGP